MKKFKPQSPLADLLRNHKMKATTARILVLKLFQSSKKPLSVSQITKELKTNSADLATLYRTVETLESKNIIRRVDFAHGHAHFEITDNKHHHHIICELCGKIVDISKCNIPALERQILKISQFSKIRHHSLEFFGICQSCAKKLSKK